MDPEPFWLGAVGRHDHHLRKQRNFEGYPGFERLVQEGRMIR